MSLRRSVDTSIENNPATSLLAVNLFISLPPCGRGMLGLSLLEISFARILLPVSVIVLFTTTTELVKIIRMNRGDYAYKQTAITFVYDLVL